MSQADFNEENNPANSNIVDTIGASAESELSEEQIMSMDLKHEGLHQAYLHKHPLQNIWTLWYLDTDRTKRWEDNQNEVACFNTVEDFWSLYNSIKPPSETKNGSDYSIFKKGIRPMWEDQYNKNGGRWIINFKKNNIEDLDRSWIDVILCLIGESFENCDQICGAVVNIRAKSNKISIWTATGDNDKVMEIGNELRQALNWGSKILHFQLHSNTMLKLGMNIKVAYTS